MLTLSEAEWAAHRQTLEAHQRYTDFEIRGCIPQGEPFWFQVSGEPTFDSAGVFTGYRGCSRDITVRKKAELAAYLAAARLEVALEASDMGV